MGHDLLQWLLHGPFGVVLEWGLAALFLVGLMALVTLSMRFIAIGLSTLLRA